MPKDCGGSFPDHVNRRQPHILRISENATDPIFDQYNHSITILHFTEWNAGHLAIVRQIERNHGRQQ